MTKFQDETTHSARHKWRFTDHNEGPKDGSWKSTIQRAGVPLLMGRSDDLKSIDGLHWKRAAQRESHRGR